MGGRLYNAGAVRTLPSSHLLFAKEPEPDVDLELQEPGTAQNQPSHLAAPAPQKPPRLRILILIILLLVVAGGAYFAMDPELVMKLTGQEQMPLVATPPVTAVTDPARERMSSQSVRRSEVSKSPTIYCGSSNSDRARRTWPRPRD